MKQNKLALLLLSPAFLMMITGCDFNKAPVTPDNPPIDDDEPNNPIHIDEDCVIAPSQEYMQFWNPSTTLSINVTMTQAAADFLNDYQCDHNDSRYHDYYVPCTFLLTMGGVEYNFEEVGVRMKGNMSRKNILTSSNFSLESLGHYKFSFKETFDDEEYTTIEPLRQFAKTWEDSAAKKARKKRTLFDMEKIDIKWNRNDDQTKSKQAYALDVFRTSGVLAGHDTLAKTTLGIVGKTPINTTYEVLECIDSVFIKRHFGETYADGDLYKCTYTDRGPANMSGTITIGNQIGVEDNTNSFHPSYDLKTNKKKNTTHENFFNLVSVVKNKSLPAAEWKKAIEKVLDMETFIKYESIAFLLGNFDDMRNNANNYYLYFTSGEKPKAFIIPYDFDRCLGAGAEGRKDYMTNYSAESTKMQCNGDWQTNNLFWRICCTSTDSASGHASIERVEDYRLQYQLNIQDLLNTGVISNETFVNYVNSFPEEYRGNPLGAGEGNTTFSNYLSLKINNIKNDVYTSGYDIRV